MIEVVGCTKSFGPVSVIAGVDFQLAAGEVTALLGPSGCGKSTLLRILAGFESYDGGEVLHDGAPVAEPGPERGLVDQASTLFPWLSLRDNLLWGPRQARRADADEIADTLLRDTGLEGFATAMPEQLSGGMRQRASIAQVLALAPPVLLLDEPFGALDAQTRIRMHGWLRGVLERRPTTVALVTHDVDEALMLADRILVLSARPATIVADVEVDLGAHRDRRTMVTPAFVAAKERLLDLVLGPGPLV